MTHRERFLAACHCQPFDRTPIWIMRQAGRYLPEYRKLKEKHSFLECVRTPELATEISLQPLRRFDLDAAILFSDILVIPEALGQGYQFKDSAGIKMDYKISSMTQIDSLDTSRIDEKLFYVFKALTLLRRELGSEMAILGFGGSPWTLAAYMTEGESSKNFQAINNLFINNRPIFNALMEKLTVSLIDYFKLKINAGVDALQIFDSWGGICPDGSYWEASLRWIKDIIDALPSHLPVILYAKGMAHHASSLSQTGSRVLSVDWKIPLHKMRTKVPPSIALQGNLDPAILSTNPEKVRNETEKILKNMRGDPGHIFNLGHGILPDARIENVITLVKTIRDFS